MAVLACNPSYLGDRYQDYHLMPTKAKYYQDPYLNKKSQA
jgi:hypothetical protein